MIEFKLSPTLWGDTEVYCHRCHVIVGKGAFRDLISIHLEKEHSFT